MMLTSLQANDLDALECVTFVGYQNGLYDTHSFLPIARRGQTATPIQLNYRGAPALLIDASVFGGSSGRPVVLLDRGMYQTRSGGTVIGMRLILLGVLAAVHVRHTGGIVQDLPARQITVFDEALDLGIVFKARAIHECVKLLLARVGAEIVVGREPVQPLEGVGRDPRMGEPVFSARPPGWSIPGSERAEFARRNVSSVLNIVEFRFNV